MSTQLEQAERERLLRQLAQQMQEFGIAPEELRQQVQPAPPPPARAPLPVPGMYVASLAGVGLLAAFAYGFWPSFSPALRLLLTLGVGMLLHVLAMTAWQKPRLWRLGQGLMLLAALWQGLGWFLLAQRALPGPAQEWACYMVAAALMLVQEAVVFRHYRHAFLLFYPLACAYALCLSLLIALGGHPIVILVGLGVSMLSLSWWLSRSTYAPLAGPWIMLGGALLFFSCYKLAQRTPLEVAYVLPALGGIWQGARRRLLPVLLTGTAAMAAYLLHATLNYGLETSLWPYALVIMGLAQFGLAAGALALWRRFGGYRITV